MPVNLSFKDALGAETTELSKVKLITYEDDKKNKYTFGVDGTTKVFNTFKYQHDSDDEIDYGTIATRFMTDGAVSTLLNRLATIETATNAANLGDKVTAIHTKTNNMPANLEDELTTIKTETNKIAAIKTNVDAIKTNTDALDLTDTTKDGKLGKALADLKIGTDKIPGIETNVGKIETKTNKMPDDLNAELDKLTVIGNSISNNTLEPAAKAKLQSTFDEALQKTIDDPQFKIDIQPTLQNKFKEAVEKAGGSSAQAWFDNHVKDVVSKPLFEIPESDDAALTWTW